MLSRHDLAPHDLAPHDLAPHDRPPHTAPMPQPPSTHASLLGLPDYAVLRARAHNLRWACVDSDVIPLTAADPDLPAPPQVVEALTQYIASPHFSYGPAAGLVEFRAAIAQHFAATKNCNINADAVTATNSAASAITLVARHLLKHGDEVVVQDPVDFLVTESVRRAGGTLRLWAHEEGRFTLDGLAAAITPRTRALFLCHPHNPMGSLWSDAEVRAIAAFAAARSIAIISDEVWSDVVLDQRACTSFAATGDRDATNAQQRAGVWVVYGLSKGYALAGLRIGAVIAPSEFEATEFRAQAGFDHTIEGASTLSQVAATAALTHCESWRAAFLSHIAQQRTHAAERLRALAGVELPTLPQATFVLFPDISATGLACETLAARIEQCARVRVVPGSPRWFGPAASGHIRLSLATTRATLDEALDRVAASWSRIIDTTSSRFK